MRLKRRLRSAITRVAIPCIAVLLRLFGWSWRVEVEGPDPTRPGAVPPGRASLGAVWHRNILIGAAVYRDRGFSVPISRSRDGDLIAAVIQRLGWAPPPRGSSSRGASSVLRQAIAQVRNGTTMAVLCDGPRGPARRVKTGVVAIAGDTGIPITPIAYSAKPCFCFPSWDGTRLPWPFARVVVRYGEAFPVAADLDDDARQAAQERLGRILNELSDRLDEEVGGPRDPARS